MRYRRAVLLLSILVMCAGVVLTAHAQGPSLSSAPAESYLDGFDVSTIMGVEEVPITGAEAWSYLDDIDQELTTLDREFAFDAQAGGLYATLDTCLATALERHLPLTIAKDKIELGKRKLVKSVRDMFPSFTFTYEHAKGFKISKEDPDPLDGADESQQYRSRRVTYELAQPLFRGGELWNQIKVDRANLNVARAEYKKVFADITLEVARAYFNLVKAYSLREMKQRLSADVCAQVIISKEKQEAGLVSEIEHLNVESQQGQTEHDVTAAVEDAELALVEFKKVLHLDMSDYVEVPPFPAHVLERFRDECMAGTADVTEENKEKLDGYVKLAYQNRPEFAIQRYKVEAATWAEKVAQSGWLPKINLVGSTGRKAEAYIAMDNRPAWDDEHHIGIEFRWNFGGNTVFYDYDKNRQGTGTEAVDMDIAQDGYYDRKNTGGIGVLDGLDQFATTKDAAIKRKQAELELELSEKDIVSEVKEAYYNYSRALVQMKAAFKKLEYREKLTALSKHRSDINEIQISEYIQAQLDYVREYEAVYKAVIDYYLAKVSLNRAIGIKDYIPVEQ